MQRHSYFTTIQNGVNTMNEVVIVSAARTPIGTLGGTLKDIPPFELAALVVKEVVHRQCAAGLQAISNGT